MHRLRRNKVFLQTVTDVMVLYTLGDTVYALTNDGIWKGDNDTNFIFIMHRCRNRDIFLLVGTDVIVIYIYITVWAAYPLGGAERSF